MPAGIGYPARNPYQQNPMTRGGSPMGPMAQRQAAFPPRGGTAPGMRPQPAMGRPAPMPGMGAPPRPMGGMPPPMAGGFTPRPMPGMGGMPGAGPPRPMPGQMPPGMPGATPQMGGQLPGQMNPQIMALIQQFMAQQQAPSFAPPSFGAPPSGGAFNPYQQRMRTQFGR